eukprot:2800052-Ditylum_brightwellii.AAC.1
MSSYSCTIAATCNPDYFRSVAFGEYMLTSFTLAGDLSDGWNHEHVDENDIISLMITLGKDVCGSCAYYYYGGCNFRRTDPSATK